MPTMIVLRRAGSTGTEGLDVQESVKDVTDLVNAAVKEKRKFVTFTRTDGNDVSIEAERVVSMKGV